MKRLLVIALLSFLLAGCVKQSDYDELSKSYDELTEKYETLEQNYNALVKDSEEPKNVYEYNGDEVTYSITGSDDRPIPTITYVTNKDVDITEQEQRITFFWAYCFHALRNIDTFNFVAWGGEARTATYQRVLGENIWSGTDRNGESTTISPDWILEWGKTQTELPIDSKTKEWLITISEQIGNDCKLRQDY